MGIFFIIIALFYALFLFFLNKNRRAFLLGIFVLLTGFMMSAFYWLAAMRETKYLNLSFLISMRYDFHKNFISLRQLFCLPWDHTTDIDGLSLQIGYAAYFIVSFFVFWGSLAAGSETASAWGETGGNSGVVAHYFFFLIIGFIAVLFTLPVSRILWEHADILRFVQLPWRFLTIAAFMVSLSAGSSILLFKKKKTGLLFIGVVAFFIILSPLKYYWHVNFQAVDQTAVQNKLSSYIFIGEGERTPKWIKVPPLAVPSQKFEIVHGNGLLSQYRTTNSIDHLVQVAANQPLLICFHTFYFPGWRAFVDGREAEIYADNPLGVIVFFVPQGEHTLRVVFGPTPVRIAGMIISWSGVILFLGMILWMKLPKRRLKSKSTG